MTSTNTGNKLIHWFGTQQLPAEAIVKHLIWKDAMRLASTCKALWQEVEWIVTEAQPNLKAALNKKIPDGLRIPLLTGLTQHEVRADTNFALRFACCNGHLRVAQWLTERFGIKQK